MAVLPEFAALATLIAQSCSSTYWCLRGSVEVNMSTMKEYIRGYSPLSTSESMRLGGEALSTGAPRRPEAIRTASKDWPTPKP